MRFSHWLLMLLLLSAPFLTGCASDKSTIAKASAANDQLAPAIVNDPQISQYIQQIGDRITASAKLYDQQGMGPARHKESDASWMFSDRMKFHVVSSPTVNAFTTGGEHLYVYTSLFEMCDNEDELAAVMSHEFAHVYCRHIQHGANRQTGAAVVTGIATAGGYLVGGSDESASASKGAGSLMQYAGMKYTRGDEAEADAWGFAFYSRAGWDPNHFADFFQKMIDAGYDKTPASQSDHPTLKSRVEAAKKELAVWDQKNQGKYLQPEIADPSTFARLKARAKAVDAAMPKDAGTQQAGKLLASFSNCVAPADQPEQIQAQKELLGDKK